MKRKNSLKAEKDENQPRMFVGGLFPETTSETVLKYFQKFGPIEEVKIIGEKQKRSRGFGFVLFKSFDSLNKAMEQQHIIDGREVDCNIAVYSNKTEVDEAAQKNDRKIFLSELGPTITKQQVQDTFQKFGSIEKVMIVKRKNKDHSFCFIIFDDESSAKQALKVKKHQVGGFVVECSVAEPKIRSYLNKVQPEKDAAKSTVNEGHQFGAHEDPAQKNLTQRASKNSSKIGSKDHSKAPSKSNSKNGELNYQQQSVNNLIRGRLVQPSEQFVPQPQLHVPQYQYHYGPNPGQQLTNAISTNPYGHLPYGYQCQHPEPYMPELETPSNPFSDFACPDVSPHAQAYGYQVDPSKQQDDRKAGANQQTGSFNSYNYINNYYHFTISSPDQINEFTRNPQKVGQGQSNVNLGSSIDYLRNLQQSRRLKESSVRDQGYPIGQQIATENFMFESYLPGQIGSQQNLHGEQRQSLEDLMVREDSKEHSKSSQLSLTRVISQDAKNRQMQASLKVQDQNYKFNQNVSDSQISRGSIPSQQTGGSSDSLNKKQEVGGTDRYLFTPGLSPTNKGLSYGILNSNIAPTMGTHQLNGDEQTLSNSMQPSEMSGMGISMQGADFQNPGIRRTTTVLSGKKRIAGASRDFVGGARLNEVHREIPAGSQIYSEIVGVNHDWSRVSASHLEESQDQLTDPSDNQKKRANSADLDKTEEVSLTEEKIKKKKKLVTSAVQMKTMQSSKLNLGGSRFQASIYNALRPSL